MMRRFKIMPSVEESPGSAGGWGRPFRRTCSTWRWWQRWSNSHGSGRTRCSRAQFT